MSKKELFQYSSYKDVPTENLTLVIKEGHLSVKQLEKVQKVMKIISLVLVYAFLVFMALVVLLPFYWMLITSLKSTTEIRATTQTLFPATVMWSNYVEVFRQFDFVTYLINTLVVGIISTIGTLVTTIFAAFAFARLNFKGKDIMFAVLLATMMIPGEMMVITNYITVANFGWLNDTRWGAYLAMIVPFWISVFYIYLLRQNFKQIPNELYLAAKVDGKSDWTYLWKVMVPLSSPTLISIFILKLMGSWNSYVWPNLVANKEQFRLITNGLRSSFTTTAGEPQFGLQMAATVLVTVPLLLLFIFFRKYIMKGVGRAGIKG
jgi:multiple sugar transport system permease protein